MRNALRVVAGSLGGRRFDAPGGDATRPTGDRVREAIFNALASLDVLDGARVLDAFAGSGALGIEALSRGAARETFVEGDGAARSVITANVTALGVADRATVLGGDGAAVARTGGPWNLVLLDPPYRYDGWDDLLTGLVPRLSPGAVIVAESDRRVEPVDGLDAGRTREYGSTVVTMLSSTGTNP